MKNQYLNSLMPSKGLSVASAFHHAFTVWVGLQIKKYILLLCSLKYVCLCLQFNSAKYVQVLT